MPLPNNNLPSSSQQWAREIEKQLASLNQANAIRRTNAISSDAATDANANNLSSLLLDQAELKSYSSEIPGTRTKVFDGTGFQLLDVTKLTQTININKERSAFIAYSASYSVRNTFITAAESYSWYVLAKIFVNGVQVGYSTVQRESTFSAGTNPYSQEYDTGQITTNKLVRLSPGSNTISVTLDIGAVSSTASTRISVSDDDLSIDIIK
jgi:hypothetical protein